ncbi:transcriptional regulator, AraC family protein [Hyphomonas adhaerens MHS-3]|uniref:Transcriptional regulator, AraC family protein n=1 Tax=Hyphomonas adhaerens MHS-3 TaxID=1280949 RepID=A0A069E8U3_9PROT|nr:AraC family transcriptional regulator [Hyphomonas adhaerens]KCZ84731.1 transcriptional regulator, AraC family protein [Hyphomonas adhaerens MHS-3]
MTDTLLSRVQAFADAHAGVSSGAGAGAPTPIPGLTCIRAGAPSELDYAISRPVVCLVLQGGKQVTMGRNVYDFGAGESLLIMADVPTISQIRQASPEAPYYSLVLDLDPAVIADLGAEMTGLPPPHGGPVRVEPTEREVADTALRLMRLLDRPASVPVLQAQLVREMHYWLLEGRHGAAIRRFGWPDGQAQRIARAVALLRSDYAQALPVERLAAEAGMSLSSFHQHFRAITSLSPLQFQKQLRLIEARRAMLAEGLTASEAAYAVGYESVPQFTREYGRLFGQPPGREIAAARARVQQSA